MWQIVPTLLIAVLVFTGIGAVLLYDTIGEHVWWVAAVVLGLLGVAYWKTR